MSREITPSAAPHNVEAEQQVLGAILCSDGAAYHRISDMIRTEHFFDPVHRRIFDICASRSRSGHLVSPVAIRPQFENDDGIRDLGGVQYLIRLAGASIGLTAVREYAGILVDAFARRTLLAALDGAREIVLKGGDPLEAQAGVEAAGAQLAVNDTRRPTTSLLAAATKAVDMTLRAYQGERAGLMSSIKGFDNLIGGLQPEDMVVLAAAPSMGKTTAALALTMAYAAQGAGVCFVSLEMADFSIAQRLLSAQTKIPYRLLRRGLIDADQGQQVTMAAAGMDSWSMEIVNSHVRDVAGIYAAARRVQKSMEARIEGGLRVIVIDYLQLVRAPAKDRFQEVAEASRGIKQMARQIGVPVIALAQISRTVAERDDKRPRLSDLQHSSQIEQDADIVLACHRDHYYLEREGPPRSKDGKVRDEARADFESALSTSKHQMDMLLLKHRHDGIGSVTLGCDMATNRLWDLQDGDVQAAMGF